MIKVLVVGQTPPPFGGQAIMIERLLQMSQPDFHLAHVRMDFSQNMEDVGKVQWRKVFRLFSLTLRIIIRRIATGSTILYYPPAGPNRVPVYRDIIILIAVRWMFRKTIFHFHAGGMSELYMKLSAPARFFFRLAYFYPDASIRISDLNPKDGEVLHSVQEFVIPNGSEDGRKMLGMVTKMVGVPPKILFVGVLCESKGVMVLLEACRLLQNRGVTWGLDIMGRFESQTFEMRVQEKIHRDGLLERVKFLGVLSGTDKFRAFGEADIFCFPTYFESESFGLVLLEAMSLGLPVVATWWRGIPSIVQDGENGFLVPIKDADALANKLEILVKDPDLRDAMGRRGREIFERRYSLEEFQNNMAEVFKTVHA